MTLPAALRRRFEAVVFDWDGTAVSDRHADATRVRALMEACCAEGLNLVLTSARDIGDVDAQLGARPSGPGTLRLAVNRGAEVFAADADGVRLLPRRTARAAEQNAAAAQTAGAPASPLATEARRVEIGLNDPADAARWILEGLWSLGIGPSQILVCGAASGSVGRDALVSAPGVTAVSVGAASDGMPAGVLSLPGGPVRFAEILADQLTRRRRRDPPSVGDETGWAFSVPAIDPRSERAAEALLTLGDGRTGTRGSVVVVVPESAPRVLVAGVYRGHGPETELLAAPLWNIIATNAAARGASRRLDLHAGTLWQAVETDAGVVEAAAFASLARPGTMALRARAPADVVSAEQGLLDADTQEAIAGPARVAEDPGSIAAALVEDRSRQDDGGVRLERVAGYTWQAHGDASMPWAEERARSAARHGYERLLRDHRRAWASRWEVCDARIDGDDELQLAVRLAIYHLVASTPADGEGPVGARGLTGDAYRGHVFWDSDSYMLPFHAATNPPSARAMLQYRVARLPGALQEAKVRGRAGACFPWESAEDGREVTPTAATLPSGEVVPIRTGDLEDHIDADIAWAASSYAAWTGDTTFAHGPGRDLLLHTARFWASRIAVEGARSHIHGVIGPDEYHEDVDDNAYTNVMARWNLRAAARVVDDSIHGWEREAAHWQRLADALVDGYDPASGIYEQFAGFSELEPLIIAQLADRRPVSAPLLLGAERVARSQVIKQADVLMLHYLVPGEVAAGSLVPNLEYYEPRTAHGSTLSPGVHAALLARACRPEEALQWLCVAARIDLDDVGATTAGGVHLAAMGTVWRTLSWGFAGLSPGADALIIDPRPLPASWGSLDVGVRYRGTPVRIRIDPAGVTVAPAGPIDVLLAPTGHREHVGSAGTRLVVPEPQGRPA
ncbi:glycoside hydrolase family 65 protein [Baekduia soli]|uniref:Glycoside hydrolase family 65 protein n=1 Tax=Baekduia soli TaxID=496014 RepID=A0A5B8U5T8_9ACTN|nr:glycosyl hydrolase family 65 protein [Baekduia soli]QEC48301.1 glycoside hydrolase family 65 protein [Baekduia soli]